MNFGVMSVASVTALCYLAAMLAKALGLPSKWLPVLCGGTGLLLGLAALYTGMPDFPGGDPLTAAAVGAVSGFAATGVHEAGKLRKEEP